MNEEEQVQCVVHGDKNSLDLKRNSDYGEGDCSCSKGRGQLEGQTNQLEDFPSDDLERGVENKITRGGLGLDFLQYRDQDNNCKSLAINSSPSVDTVI